MRRAIVLLLLFWGVGRAYRRWWAVDTKGRVGQDVRYW